LTGELILQNSTAAAKTAFSLVLVLGRKSSPSWSVLQLEENEVGKPKECRLCDSGLFTKGSPLPSSALEDTVPSVTGPAVAGCWGS